MDNNFKKYMPSRKIISFVVLPLFFISLFFIINNIIKYQKDNHQKAVDRLKKNINFSLKERDTDKDGLLDWQERLYGTDIKNKDTDGDGASDGDEVKGKTDPLDKFNFTDTKEDIEQINEEKYIHYRDDKKLTLIDKISRDIFVKTIDLKSNNLIKNKGAVELVSEEIFSDNDVFGIDFKNISKKDLIFSKNTSIKKFKSNLFIVLNKNERLMPKENELILSYKMIVENDLEARKQLEQNLGFLKNFQKELMKIKLPNNDKQLVNIYIKYINSINLLKTFVKNSLDYNKDPLKSLAFLQSYSKIIDIISIESKKLINHLNK